MSAELAAAIRDAAHRTGPKTPPRPPADETTIQPGYCGSTVDHDGPHGWGVVPNLRTCPGTPRLRLVQGRPGEHYRLTP